jgi:hypothetical protein
MHGGILEIDGSSDRPLHASRSWFRIGRAKPGGEGSGIWGRFNAPNITVHCAGDMPSLWIGCEKGERSILGHQRRPSAPIPRACMVALSSGRVWYQWSGQRDNRDVQHSYPLYQLHWPWSIVRIRTSEEACLTGPAHCNLSQRWEY